MPEAWRSYDAVADAYARVRAVRNAVLARDLVAAVAPPFGSRVLDVGAGTGVAAAAAAAATGADGVVVAADPSLALLERASVPRRFARVVAAAPGLPWPVGTFDAIVANLVVAHFADYEGPLAELVDLLRPGGRLGVTTWGRLGDGPPVDDRQERSAYAAWDAAAAEVADLEALDAAGATDAPWEGWFGDPANLRAALDHAGVRRVEMLGRAYRYKLTHDDWLAAHHTSARGRALRRSLDGPAWDAFENRVRTRMRDTGVPDPVGCVDQAIIAVGTSPGRRPRP
jgi:SAM-dependent methyltransferase